MSAFVWALAGFVGLHIGVSATGARGRLVAVLGEGLYRALFSLASLILLGAMIWALGAVRADPFNPLNEVLWAPPLWLYWPSIILITLGIVLAVTGVLTPGPTQAGFEKALSAPEPARGVLRITRHPFLWGVALWGVGHALANGERFALMLFGALALMVLFGTRFDRPQGRGARSRSLGAVCGGDLQCAVHGHHAGAQQLEIRRDRLARAGRAAGGGAARRGAWAIVWRGAVLTSP
ncbi:MAG: NnrU family protein [Terricaulis sp.]|nr:NnrU family protein [Terricaulis sp.]